MLLRSLKGVTNYRFYDRAVFAWGLVLVSSLVGIAATRPGTYLAHVVVAVMAVFIFLLVFPNRFMNQVILSTVIALGELVLIALSSQPPPPPAMLAIVLSVVLAMATALASSWHLHVYRRRAFAASEKEQAAVKALRQLTGELETRIAAQTTEICRDKDTLEQRIAQRTAELRESEERFRTAFEDGAIPMTLTAMDGRLLKVNSAFCQMLGYTQAELASRSFADFTHPEDLARNRAGIEQLARGEAVSFRMEKRYLRKDASLILVDMSTATVRDAQGKPLYLVTHVEDVSERRKAEEASRESEERFRTMANALPQLAWVAQPDGFIYWYNQRWYDYTGTTPSKWKGGAGRACMIRRSCLK